MRKLFAWIILLSSFSNANSVYYAPTFEKHPVILIAIIGLAVVVMLLLFFFLEHQKKLGKHDEVVIDMPLRKNMHSNKPFRQSYEKYVPEREKSSEKLKVVTENRNVKKPEVKERQIKSQQKITDIGAKLSKYEGNKQILDVQKGIAKSHTAIFYKELLQDVQVSLKDSENFVEKSITQGEYKNLEDFIVKAIRHSEGIQANKFLKLLKEIHQLFIYKEHHRLSEYISLYNRTLHELQREIETYLKSSAL